MKCQEPSKSKVTDLKVQSILKTMRCVTSLRLDSHVMNYLNVICVDQDEFQEQNPLRIVFVFIRTYALESKDENVLKFAKVQKYLKV